MNYYNDFNSMYNAQNNIKNELSVFNEIYYESERNSEPGCPIGAYLVSIGGNDYLSIACYRDSDIRDAEEGGYAYDPNGWSGILILDNKALSKYSRFFDDNDCKDLYEQIMGEFAQKYCDKPIVELYDPHTIDFDCMLSKSAARKLAKDIDNYIDDFIESTL